MATMTTGASRPEMKIGDVARRSGFTVRTIRFYERRGLLTPAARRESGYRLYTEVELDRLALIRHAKTLGLTLAEIRSLVMSFGESNGPGMRARVVRALGERIRQTTDQLEILTQLRRDLQRRRRALLRRAPRRHGNGHCSCLEQSRRRR